MPRLQIKPFLVFVILYALYTKGHGQSIQPDSTLSIAAQNAVDFYSTTLTEQLRVYSGTEYKDYARPFKQGHPYFATGQWSKGVVNYDGETYKDLLLLYNLVTDEVIILGYDNSSKIALPKNRVKHFFISGHHFLNIPQDSLFSANISPGFYDVLANGKASLLARRSKNIQTTVTSEIELKVYSKDHYYIKVDHSFFPVTNKKLLLEPLKSRKSEVQQYMRQNRLRFKRDPENTMIKVINYYNQLIK